LDVRVRRELPGADRRAEERRGKYAYRAAVQCAGKRGQGLGGTSGAGRAWGRPRSAMGKSPGQEPLGYPVLKWLSCGSGYGHARPQEPGGNATRCNTRGGGSEGSGNFWRTTPKFRHIPWLVGLLKCSREPCVYRTGRMMGPRSEIIPLASVVVTAACSWE